jgi:ABC-type antimicrobial peptide transport system permease subunit
MLQEARHLVSYRFARLLRMGWATYLAVVLVIGGIGGAALSSLVIARETQTSFATLLNQSNPAQLNVTIFAPNLVSKLSSLPGVAHVEGSLYSMAAFPLNAKGVAYIPQGMNSGDVTPLGSIGGEFFDQDKVSVVAGRMANPKTANEFVATAASERLMHWHVGQHILMGLYEDNTDAATSPAELKHPVEKFVADLVGTVVFYDDVTQDEVDRYPTWLLFTPKATAPLDKGDQYVDYALKLRPGVSVAQVENEFVKAVPPNVTYTLHETSIDESQVNSSVRPEALAFGVFGALVLLSTLLVALQLIARQLRVSRDEQATLRALGASRHSLVVDAVSGSLAAIVVGTVAALIVAFLLSPLSPIGPVAPLLGGRYHFNVQVLVPGVAVLLLVSLLGAIVIAARSAPGRRRRHVYRAASSPAFVRAASSVGLPASAVAGLHFAFESGRGRAAPVRSVLVGVALAVTLIGTTLTFGAGLSTLVSHPALYGWNWDYALTNTGGGVAPQSLNVLSKSPYVAAWSGVTFADVDIDGLTVPTMLEASDAKVSPPLLSGHEVRAKDQIVLGEATLAALHKRVGQTVTLSYGSKAQAPAYLAPMRDTIVGTATLPAIGRAQVLHTSLGSGAVVDSGVITGGLKTSLLSNLIVSDLDMVLVRMTLSSSHAERLSAMRQAARAGDRAYAALPNDEGGGVSMVVLPVQYPAEIINYRSIGDTPVLLAMGFALGVAGAFAFTVVASVRRRRRDLALLKTLGFTRRQLSACIAWQSSASVLTGLVIGIPLGIVFGRWLWLTFAREIFAVPSATIPTLSLVVLGVSAMVLANVVAFFPGRAAARTAAAVAFRSE